MLMQKEFIKSKLLLELHKELEKFHIENVMFISLDGGNINILLEGFRQANGIFEPSIGLICFKNGKFVIETLISTTTKGLYADITVNSTEDIVAYIEWKRTQSKPFNEE